MYFALLLFFHNEICHHWPSPEIINLTIIPDGISKITNAVNSISLILFNFSSLQAHLIIFSISPRLHLGNWELSDAPDKICWVAGHLGKLRGRDHTHLRGPHECGGETKRRYNLRSVTGASVLDWDWTECRVLAALWTWKVFCLLPRREFTAHLPCWMGFCFQNYNGLFSPYPTLIPYFFHGSLGSESTFSDWGKILQLISSYLLNRNYPVLFCYFFKHWFKKCM